MQLRTGRTRSRRLQCRTNSASSDSSIEDLREIHLFAQHGVKDGQQKGTIPSHPISRRRNGAPHVQFHNAFDGDSSENSSTIGGLSKDFGRLSNGSDSGISSSVFSLPNRNEIRHQQQQQPRRAATERSLAQVLAPSLKSTLETPVGRRDSLTWERESGSSSEESSSSHAYYSSSSSSPVSSSSSPGDDDGVDRMAKLRKTESPLCRRRRWLKTADILKKSGLLDITIKTAELLRKNQKIQKEIENLQKETNKFVLSVLSNPENKHILDNIQSQAQLYEFVVPGSQTIMMKTSSSSSSSSSANSSPETSLSIPCNLGDISTSTDLISSCSED